MLRWLIVCALLAQTLASPRPSRRASWPQWMRMPHMEWPDWMPTQEDLPEVTIPEIQLPEMPNIQLPEMPNIQLPEMPKLPKVDIPDVEIPEINMQMPVVLSDMLGRSRGNPAYDVETTERPQTSQSGQGNGQTKQRKGGHDIHIEQASNGQQRPSSYNRDQMKRRKGQWGNQRVQNPGQGSWGHPSQSNPWERSNGQGGMPRTYERPTTGRGWQPDTPQNIQGRPFQTDQWPGASGQRGGMPWTYERPTTGRGWQQQTSQNIQGRPIQTNPGGSWQGWRRPDGNTEQTRQESQGWPSFERNHQDRPSQGNKHLPSGYRRPTASKERKSPRQTREGPPQREELVGQPVKSRRLPSIEQPSTRQRLEPSVKKQVEDFRLGMPRWMQDKLNDTFTTMKHEVEQGRLRIESWAADVREAAEEWRSRWSGRGNSQSRPQTYGRPEMGRRPSNRPSGYPGRHHGNGRGQGHQGRGHGISNGRGHEISNGRGHDSGRTWYNQWFEERNERENRTSCRRPFRPPFESPRREEPEYTVLCGGNDYEARLYNSTSVWVAVTVSALTYDLAMYEAYWKLYRYVNGHNSQRALISRTVPLQTKVSMDSGDNRWFECHNYTVSFYLPEYVEYNPPTPNDPDLFVYYEEPQVYYAHAFRGYALEFNIWEYVDELTNTLDLSGEFYQTQDFVVNVYDAPWRFFNRRNEILLAMNTDYISMPSCSDVGTTALPTAVTTEKQTVTEVKTVTTSAVGETTVTDETTTPYKTTKSDATEVPPTAIGEIPIAIIELPVAPIVKNPFENNDLEEEIGVDCEAGSECPRYATAVSYNGFEQRHYAYSRWICMDHQACDFERAQWLTQGPLLEYFYPKGNREQTTIQITTPLVIGMDEADLYRSDCEVMYTSCMFIPEEHQSAPPTPRDARLYLQDIPAMSRYVSTFGGFASSQNVPKLSVQFLTKLAEAQLPYDSSIVAVAQYTTSKLEKTRINELWVMDQSLIQGELGLE